MNKKSSFKNKNIVIFGASYGIGEELAKKFSNQNANIALIARSKDKITKLSKDLKGDNIAIPCDVTILKEVNKLNNILIKKWSKIDLIIYAIGTYKPMNIKNFDQKEVKKIIDINILSFFNFLAEFRQSFISKNISHLAVISSSASYFGMHNSLAYGASKSALSNITESLYYELLNYKVKVQLINPGFVKTRLTDQNDFKMPFIISPEKAANIIIKNLSKDKFEIRFPSIFTFLMKFLSILPYRLRFFLLKNVK